MVFTRGAKRYKGVRRAIGLRWPYRRSISILGIVRKKQFGDIKEEHTRILEKDQESKLGGMRSQAHK
jgi:hypothetical protein